MDISPKVFGNQSVLFVSEWIFRKVLLKSKIFWQWDGEAIGSEVQEPWAQQLFRRGFLMGRIFTSIDNYFFWDSVMFSGFFFYCYWELREGLKLATVVKGTTFYSHRVWKSPVSISQYGAKKPLIFICLSVRGNWSVFFLIRNLSNCYLVYSVVSNDYYPNHWSDYLVVDSVWTWAFCHIQLQDGSIAFLPWKEVIIQPKYTHFCYYVNIPISCWVLNCIIPGLCTRNMTNNKLWYRR